MPLRQRQEIQEVLRHERAGLRWICLAVLFSDEKYDKRKVSLCVVAGKNFIIEGKIPTKAKA